MHEDLISRFDGGGTNCTGCTTGATATGTSAGGRFFFAPHFVVGQHFRNSDSGQRSFLLHDAGRRGLLVNFFNGQSGGTFRTTRFAARGRQ